MKPAMTNFKDVLNLKLDFQCMLKFILGFIASLYQTQLGYDYRNS